MSKTTENDLTKSYSGIFGNQVVLKNRRGKSVMTIPPAKPVKEPTANMVKARKQFKLASRYAKNAMLDPDKLVAYTAKSRGGMPPYVVALTDYLRPPFVDQIDVTGYRGTVGNKISVIALDDFELTKVEVKILDPSGNLIEEGLGAFNLTTGNYDFTATVSVSKLKGVTIIANAYDIPGHTGELSVTL